MLKHSVHMFTAVLRGIKICHWRGALCEDQLSTCGLSAGKCLCALRVIEAICSWAECPAGDGRDATLQSAGLGYRRRVLAF
jgi:hypothetical protein